MFRDLSHGAGLSDIPLQFPTFGLPPPGSEFSRNLDLLVPALGAPPWARTKGGRTAKTPPSRGQSVRPPVLHSVQRFWLSPHSARPYWLCSDTGVMRAGPPTGTRETP